MSLKRSMLKTLAMLAMESTMTADKNIYSNQRLSNEGMRFVGCYGNSPIGDT